MESFWRSLNPVAKGKALLPCKSQAKTTLFCFWHSESRKVRFSRLFSSLNWEEKRLVEKCFERTELREERSVSRRYADAV